MKNIKLTHAGLSLASFCVLLAGCKIEMKIPVEGVATNASQNNTNGGYDSAPPDNDPGTPPPTSGGGNDGGGTGGTGGTGGGTGGGGTTPPPGGSTPSQRNYSTDPATFGGAPRCSSELLFCDDFETPAVGQPPSSSRWTLNVGSGNSATIDNTFAMRGSKSLRIYVAKPSVPRVADPSKVRTRQFFSRLTQNRFFGRFFVRFGALPKPCTPPTNQPWKICPTVDDNTTQAYAHWSSLWTGSWVEAQGNTPAHPASHVVRIGGQIPSERGAANHFWAVDTDGGPVGDRMVKDDQNNNNLRTLENRWTCVEWEFNGDTEHSTVWIDGVARPYMDSYNSRSYSGGDAFRFTYPTMNYVELGWWLYQDTRQEFNVWYDEVVFDNKRIGCDL